MMSGGGDQALARQVISLIDLTDLDDAHRIDGIESLVDDALRHSTAAICVWPEFVESIRRRPGDGERLTIATVVNFPTGTSSTTDVVAATRRALDDGADEIDMVLPFQALRSGNDERCREMVSAVSDVVHAVASRKLKVIVESGVLGSPDLIRTAARIAIGGGADFVKTSTGKTGVGATLTAVDAIVDEILVADRTVGLKASGGIRTVADAAPYLELADRRLGSTWAVPETFRFGASSLLVDAVERLHG